MWIVLDPEPDRALARFNDTIDATNWIVDEIKITNDPDRVAMLQRCVIAPFDPKRDA